MAVQKPPPLAPATPEEAAFMAELERLNGGPGSFTKGAPPGEFAAIGRRWAEGEPLPNLHPYVLHELTDGAEGEPPPADSYRFRSWASMAAQRIEDGTGKRAAELFLVREGWTAREAAQALSVAQDRGNLYDRGKLPPETLERLERLEARLRGLRAIARLFLPPNLMDGSGATPDAPAEHVLEEHAPHVTREDVDRLRESIRAMAERVEREDAPGLFLEWMIRSPDPESRKLTEEIEQLAQPAAMDEEARAAALERLRTREDGTRRADPVAWVDASPWKHIRGIMLQHLETLARQEAERRAEEAEAENERLRAALLAQQQEAKGATGIVQLGDRLSLPRPAVDVARKDAGGFADLLSKIDQGELFAGEPTVAVLREAEVTVERRQFAELSTPEIRGLCGVFRAFSSMGDNGREFTDSVLSLDARTMYDACGVDARQPKSCRELFDALRKLSERDVYVPLTFQDGDQFWVMGERTPVCQVRPVWSPEKREDADAIARAWIRQERGGKEEWTGPLPDKYVLTLPGIMRKVWGALVVSGDVLQRLEDGAKQERGKGQGFRPIDWALFLELTQTTQAQQLADNLQSLCSYIDRDAFILAHHGREKVESYRKRRHYKTLVAEYEKAAQVLLAAGICTSWKPGSKGKRGPRDVFTLSPDVVHGLAERAERQRKRQQARALNRPKRRKRTGERGIRRGAE